MSVKSINTEFLYENNTDIFFNSNLITYKNEIKKDMDFDSDVFNNECEILNEFDKYINDKNIINIENFWNKNQYNLPKLYMIYNMLKTITTSNGPLEQSFSILKMIVHWKRNKSSVQQINLRIVLNDYFNFQNK